MKFYYKVLVGAALTAVLPGSAMAQRADGFYIGGAGGVGFADTAKVHIPGSGHEDLKYQPGYGASGEVGYGFDNGLRTGLELGYLDNAVDKTTGFAGGDKGGGSTRALIYMLNLYYDIPTGTAFTPYIGAGVGGATLNAHHIQPTPAGSSLNGTDTVFAYQGIAGVSYALDNVAPNLAATLDYRYLGTQDPKFDVVGGGRAKAEYSNNIIMVGLRYSFGAPPAPAPEMVPVAEPVAAATPAPVQTTRNYLVFFDFDKSILTPQARHIINDAADNAKRGGASRIEVTGHTDTVGTQRYNLALSIRRADAVKGEFVRLGIPASEIAATGVGKLHPLVATADGVREPSNRRVEIVFP
ncbi:MAG: outer membrane beta-barrel protein [Azospirillaceae bacterium]|nr:outer membrane beta-barrel protein [Azospirillaceae bacterium]